MKASEVAGFAAQAALPIRPRHLGELTYAARLERRPSDEIIALLGAATRRQFEQARRREGGVLPVVIPVQNEAGDLPKTLVALARGGEALPIVVNNKSSDETRDVAIRMGAVVIDQPKGRKMAATQAGIRFARDELSAKQILFTDGDTTTPRRWAGTMALTLAETDIGNGAAVFPASIGMFGKSHLANVAGSALSQMYAVMHQKRGTDPVAHGHNYGLQFDDAGRMEEELSALHPDLFIDDHSEPDDLAIRNATIRAGAAVRGTHNPDLWVVTRNDRVSSLRGALGMALGKATYQQVTGDSYAQEYGLAARPGQTRIV